MDIVPTIITLLVAVAISVWASYKAKQPFDPMNPRLVPYTGLIFVAAVVAVYMVVHLVNLAGFETGRR